MAVHDRRPNNLPGMVATRSLKQNGESLMDSQEYQDDDRMAKNL